MAESEHLNRIAELERRMDLIEKLVDTEVRAMRREHNAYRSIVAAAGDVLRRLGDNGHED